MKKKKINPKKYTLETPIVKAFIAFYGCPLHLRPDDLKTQADFLKKYNINSNGTLHNYEKIKGFWEAVYSEQKKYARVFVLEAKKGLLKRARGMTCKRQQVAEGAVYNLTVEVPPDPAACKILLQAHDELTEKMEFKADSLTDLILNTAANYKKNKDEDADGEA